MARRSTAALAALGVGTLLAVSVVSPSAAEPAGDGWNWLASEGFTDTQGYFQWSYEQRNAAFGSGNAWSPMSYDTAESAWEGTAPYATIGEAYMHPAQGFAVSRTWTAPYEGLVQVTGSAAMGGSGGDGVTVAITADGFKPVDYTVTDCKATATFPGTQTMSQSSVVLWQKHIDGGDNTGYAHGVWAWVEVGDQIRFVVDSGATNSFDTTNWDPRITYNPASDSMEAEGWRTSVSQGTEYYDHALAPPYTPDPSEVYQDGGLAMARDSQGQLWSVMGNTSLKKLDANGDPVFHKLSVWKGTTSTNMQYEGEPELDFELGEAGTAFDGVPYPDGPQSRGALWPHGLWIDDNDVFYMYFHNETSWRAGDSAYTTTNDCEDAEPDFRHIGLATSTDFGQTWEFDSWVLTAEQPSWTDLMIPDAGLGSGQSSSGSVALGAGDFGTYEHDGYLYIYYGIGRASMGATQPGGGGIYVSRTQLSSSGAPGAWYNYHDGEWTEPGNGGEASALMEGAFEPHVSYNSYLNKFLMVTYNFTYDRSRFLDETKRRSLAVPQISFSDDLVNWTDPKPIFDNPNSDPLKVGLNYAVYNTLANQETTGNPYDTAGVISMFYNSNGQGLQYVYIDVRDPADVPPVAEPEPVLATGAPGTPVLSNTGGYANGLKDGNYSVSVDMWWGNNGTTLDLYENGELVKSQALTDASPAAQSVQIPFTSRVNGTYTYVAELRNGFGVTQSQPMVVTVTDAAPGTPSLSHDNWDGDGSFTMSADLWWGTNATQYRLFENGVAIASGSLASLTPNAQHVRIAVSGRPVGSYNYRVEFINPAGTTSSSPLSVVVVR